jgi:signal transduction histidine kinase
MWIFAGIVGIVLGSGITVLLLRHRVSPPSASASSLRQTVMRGIAHEIRNPLNTMSITLQLLEEDLAPETETDDEGFLGDVRRVRREVDRLERILSDFQRYARMQYRREEVDIGALVNEILDFMEGEAARANVEIKRAVPAAITTAADPSLLRQAFLNVIVNAFQAIGEGGTLTVQVEPGANIIVSFTDTGDGMDEDARRRVFEPYYSTKQDGTGLGLAVVKEVAEMHAGGVDVRSSPGDGATVSLSIPLVTQATAPE